MLLHLWGMVLCLLFFLFHARLCCLRIFTFCSFLSIFFHTTPFYMTHAMDYTGFGLTGGFMIKSNGVLSGYEDLGTDDDDDDAVIMKAGLKHHGWFGQGRHIMYHSPR
ncbi:hypothetical protein ASPBRDRAFT_408403 [Aspergillus brasiliensis CBS 101740]|uniref:Uncharacterized protein n=1 Tax=Aspergillus brasiliensis (strain CBS 101740 / IMI 381727 / IBT 21946) TaxID=767769 RepID=A0A1L9UXR6_ASPBC|nr:hypothetical protein ASPBRDRAFT_408403 [Aspergillus brasiliensis CBS 101740]